MAAERWRRAHGGALPESAEALVPDWLDAVPLDAELGGPLRLGWRLDDPSALRSLSIRLEGLAAELVPAGSRRGGRLLFPIPAEAGQGAGFLGI